MTMIPFNHKSELRMATRFLDLERGTESHMPASTHRLQIPFEIAANEGLISPNDDQNRIEVSIDKSVAWISAIRNGEAARGAFPLSAILETDTAIGGTAGTCARAVTLAVFKANVDLAGRAFPGTTLLDPRRPSEWAKLLRQPALSGSEISADDIPPAPGVYTFIRRGEILYVGAANSLRSRIWGNHMSEGISMGGSAYRRNVTELFGTATAADIKERRYKTTERDAKHVTYWTHQSSIKWRACESREAAVDLERRLKAEWMPPLTKR